jgi:hypothetical protein
MCQLNAKSRAKIASVNAPLTKVTTCFNKIDLQSGKSLVQIMHENGQSMGLGSPKHASELLANRPKMEQKPGQKTDYLPLRVTPSPLEKVPYCPAAAS